ncbi:MAG: hypothetical protein CVV64_21140 [Candidatus Wallbacteria bacterium HGW-Wallbacteria-1]|jgi:signal transduction histidine kinase|uniref:histidine kinase n=1 Tax=Candidatus Wallbacteria bacterium HGW-Wallbacteria-1 TaxID=2013854 RepID=A0A2N1PHV0_9BACT|nr:MAG: hypothetical protein CVV64_21140 [Candidatus Wallbacteria bacterium HGW-Wallbacteria-1]
MAERFAVPEAIESVTGNDAETEATILIVDDSATSRRIASEILKNYNVTEAESGEDALIKLEKIEPDLVLMDLVMPGMSGFETCATILRQSKFRDLPVIIVSSKNMEQDIWKGLETGAVDYIIKPYSPLEMVARVRAALRLRRTIINLRQLNELKNSFLGMASHDLRNPVSVIYGYSDFLLKNLDNASIPKDEFLKVIFKSSQFMLELLDDLLDISKIEAGKLILDRQEADFVALLRENVATNTILATNKNISVELKADGDIPPISLDRLKIEQVLNNLISNAIKYTNPGTEVSIRTFMEAGEIITVVRDQGPGIPAEEASKIFEPFEKGSARATANEKSTGLGLAIARKIVEGHGGRIFVESQVGSGSTFGFTLPV